MPNIVDDLPLTIKWVIGIVFILMVSFFVSYRLSDITQARPYLNAMGYEVNKENPQIVFKTKDDSNQVLNFYNSVFGGFGLFNGGGVYSVSVGKEQYQVTEIDYYWTWILFHRDVRIMVYPTDEAGVNQVLIRAF